MAETSGLELVAKLQKTELSAVEVSRLVAPGRHSVGPVPGLALQVQGAEQGSARSWVLRYQVAGKRREMGLGAYPAVGLADARRRAREIREGLDKGVDPIAQRRAVHSAMQAKVLSATTFRKAAEQYVAAHEAGWRSAKHGAQWSATLDTYAHPVMGDLDVADIRVSHVLRALEPLWATKTETAKRLRGRIESVIAWADKRAERDRPNPARWKNHLEALLPSPSKVATVEHHPAVPVSEAGAFMQMLRQAEGLGARALEFVILTAARSGEVRGAEWPEFDLDAGLWTVPGVRMKSGKEHRVPLSKPAVELLKALPRFARAEGEPDLVFPGARNRPLSDMSLTAVMRRMGLSAVPHGFRSTFRDWASERTSFPHEVCEMALAHAVGNKVEAAYRRGDLFQKRRFMMAEWANFLERPENKGTVVPFDSGSREAASG